MLKILYRDRKACPIIACDVCGDMIGAIGDGVAVFFHQPIDNGKVSVVHVHKGLCQLQAHASSTASEAVLQDLTAHFVVALINSCMTKEAFEDMLRRLAQERDDLEGV